MTTRAGGEPEGYLYRMRRGLSKEITFKVRLTGGRAGLEYSAMAENRRNDASSKSYVSAL